MNDDSKLRDFATRITRRQITDGEADAAEPVAVYVRVAVGTSRRNAATVGKVEDVDRRDPAEIVETIRAILAGNDGEEPRGYCAAYRVGESNPFDSVIVELGQVDEAATTKSTVEAGSIGQLAMVIERMARNADNRAEAADFRAESAQRSILGFLERAMNAERDAGELELVATLGEGQASPVVEALRELSPLIKIAGMKMLGARPAKGQIPAKPASTPAPEPVAAAPEDPAPETPSTSSPSEPDTAAEAKRAALDAVAALQELYGAFPELARDADLVEGMSPLVLAALADPPAPRG